MRSDKAWGASRDDSSSMPSIPSPAASAEGDRDVADPSALLSAAISLRLSKSSVVVTTSASVGTTRDPNLTLDTTSILSPPLASLV